MGDMDFIHCPLVPHPAMTIYDVIGKHTEVEIQDIMVEMKGVLHLIYI